MAVGNTFGATALSSYGGFWLSFAIILTPGGFRIEETLGGGTAAEFQDSFGFFLMVRFWKKPPLPLGEKTFRPFLYWLFFLPFFLF
jgi:succinate-acetate transporter protein